MEKRLQTVNHNNLMALWSKRVEACRNSGLTVSEWCEENGISKSTYYTWQRKVFCTMTQGQSAPELVEVPLGQASTRFQPVATLHAGNLSAEIYSSADAGVLEALCRAMKSC